MPRGNWQLSKDSIANNESIVSEPPLDKFHDCVPFDYLRRTPAHSVQLSGAF